MSCASARACVRIWSAASSAASRISLTRLPTAATELGSFGTSSLTAGREYSISCDKAEFKSVPYIRLIGEDEATGELADEYAAARGRAGKVFNIIKAISLRPRALRAMLDLYREVMFGRSELSRADRELLAVVVSRVNDCHY